MGALLIAANFSVGVHVMLHAARTMAAAFRSRPEFEGLIVETHHRAQARRALGHRRSPSSAPRGRPAARSLPVTSIRAGAVPGTHELRYEGPFESLSLEHVARDRSVFGTGAVLAAEWLVGRTGVFTFEDVLFGKRA